MLLDNSRPPFEHSSVLLVDCDQDTRLMYGEYFRRFAIDLDQASDGREALAKALIRPHDVIVTETRLPGINGYDLCRLLRRDTSTQSTPIIVVTGEAQPTNLERAHRSGADVVLVKPCLPDLLLSEMRRLTSRSDELRAHSHALRARADEQLSRAHDLQQRMRRRALSRTFVRADTTKPPVDPPVLVCPACDRPLIYQRSHVGGVSERHAEQWDYFECPKGCGNFQYRQRTRKLRKVS
jgi:two-component system, cell cycle response regulator DivK